MHHRLAEPNRVLAPRRSFRATATSWIGAGILHALVLILLLLLLAPVRESTTTTYLIPVEPGTVPIAADAPSEASPSAPEAGRSATVSGVTTPRATGEEDVEEAEGVLTIEVPATGVTTSEGTAASSGARALRGSTMPLIATPYGIGRRPVVRDQARITRMRAESLVNAMIASVIEVKPPMRAGPLSFPQGGGVSIPIPWGGFVRDDRGDETWREERCGGGDDDEGDKPGEEEARGSQCD